MDGEPDQVGGQDARATAGGSPSPPPAAGGNSSSGSPSSASGAGVGVGAGAGAGAGGNSGAGDGTGDAHAKQLTTQHSDGSSEGLRKSKSRHHHHHKRGSKQHVKHDSPDMFTAKVKLREGFEAIKHPRMGQRRKRFFCTDTAFEHLYWVNGHAEMDRWKAEPATKEPRGISGKDVRKVCEPHCSALAPAHAAPPSDSHGPASLSDCYHDGTCVANLPKRSTRVIECE